MPRSKRNKQIELAKTKKRGLDWKKHLFGEVRSCVDKYENIFLFSVNDFRNNKMKLVREQWKHSSRFFIGKNKIMAMALGRFSEEEYRPNIHKLGQQIKGQRGLLFSNKPVEEVLNWFRSYSEADFARSGNTATETVHLPTGPLTMFPHNLEPYLRQLGLPTTLVKGVIHLIKDHEVCKAGDVLTPDTAKILKLLGYEMAEFHITIDCVWSKDGTFMQLTDSIDTDIKENKKQKLKLNISSNVIEENNAVKDEEMEIEQNDEESSLSEEEKDSKEVKNSLSDSILNVVKSDLNTIGTTTSTPIAKINDITDNDASYLDKDTTIPFECDMEEVAEENNDKSQAEIKNGDRSSTEVIPEKSDEEAIPKKNNDKSDKEAISEIINDKNDEVISEITNDKNDEEAISEKNNDKIDEKAVSEKNNDEEAILEKSNDKTNEKAISGNSNDESDEEAMSEIGNDKNGVEAMSENIDEAQMEETLKDKNEKVSDKSDEKETVSKKGRPRVAAKTPKTTKKANISKRESLLKTPDANTSQDSPVFRELRNRSVKVIRKRKK